MTDIALAAVCCLNKVWIIQKGTEKGEQNTYIKF